MDFLDRVIGRLRHKTTTGLQLDAMDAFRGWAILGVIAIHAGYNNDWATQPNYSGMLCKAVLWVAFQGWVGVNLFFFLSGFLLFVGFGKAHYENRQQPSMLVFFKRRSMRIIPAFYFYLIAAYAINSLLHWRTSSIYWDVPTMAEFIPFFVFMNNLFPGSHFYGILWSLAAEVHFYLVLPFIANWFFGSRWRISFPLLFFASAIYKILIVKMVYSLKATDFIILTQPLFNDLMWNLDPFIFGMVFANLWLYLEIGGCKNNYLVKVRYLPEAAFLAGVSMLMLSLCFQFSFGLWGYHFAVLLPLMSLSFGLMVMGTLYSTVLKRIMANRLMVIFGIISYSVFLWHYTVMNVLKALIHYLCVPGVLNTLILATLTLVSTIVVSFLSYIYIERPFLKPKARPEAGNKRF